MLGKLYLQQKLEVIRGFRDIPRDISNHIMAINDVRNGLAHRLDLKALPKSKRLYKAKYDLLTRKGLDKFRKDMWDVTQFFAPEAIHQAMQDVKRQRAINEGAKPTKRLSRSVPD